jgi:hypothetical protein
LSPRTTQSNFLSPTTPSFPILLDVSPQMYVILPVLNHRPAGGKIIHSVLSVLTKQTHSKKLEALAAHNTNMITIST